MYKKIAVFLLVFLLGMLIWQPGARAGKTDNIHDELDYLSAGELEELQSLIQDTVENYNLDVAIVITDDTGGKSSRDFADDYYDDNGFGIGSDYSGLLMLINMDEREMWISTTGRAIDIFTDNRISAMTGAITGLLSNGSYYEACKEFIRRVESYVRMGVPQGQHRIDTSSQDRMVKEVPLGYWDKAVRMMGSLPVVIIALVISLIATLIASSNHKGRVTINSTTYEEKGSFALTGIRDDYIRESTTRVKIQSSSSNSSSTHRGSSGRTHGGGGGKF